MAVDLSTAPAASKTISALDEERFIRQIDWNLFGQFFAIVQAGSLSAAARQLNLQQPSLSAALKRLEDHLGVVLCHRGARGIKLTPAGKALLKLCGEMVESVRMVPHLTSQAAGRVEGVLSIRLISNVVSVEFNDALASFHSRHPNVEIKLDVSPWRAVFEALSQGKCEIGVTYDSGPRSDFQYEPLFRETQQLYCGASHHLYGQQLREPAIIGGEPFILTNEDEPEELQRFRMRFNLGTASAGQAQDLHEASRLIELGIGIGFLPTIAAELRTTKRLWPLLSTPLLPSYFIYLVTPPVGHMTTPAQLFLDEVRRRLRAKEVYQGRAGHR